LLHSIEAKTKIILQEDLEGMYTMEDEKRIMSETLLSREGEKENEEADQTSNINHASEILSSSVQQEEEPKASDSDKIVKDEVSKEESESNVELF
ncbi:MAG: hypothetical protein V3S49_01660, partial [Thermodesulfobacteriota bacterium]